MARLDSAPCSAFFSHCVSGILRAVVFHVDACCGNFFRLQMADVVGVPECCRRDDWQEHWIFVCLAGYGCGKFPRHEEKPTTHGGEGVVLGDRQDRTWRSDALGSGAPHACQKRIARRMGGYARHNPGLAFWNVPRSFSSMAVGRGECAPDYAGASFRHVSERLLGTPVEPRFPPADAPPHFPA